MQTPDADSTRDTGPQSRTVDQMHILSVETGRYAETAKTKDSTARPQGEAWHVKRGGFVFHVQLRIPVQLVKQDLGEVANDTAFITNSVSNTSFYAKAMQLKEQLLSKMMVTVRRHGEPEKTTLVPDDGKGTPASLDDDKGNKKGTSSALDDDGPVLAFTPVKPVMKQVPEALWGICKSPTPLGVTA